MPEPTPPSPPTTDAASATPEKVRRRRNRKPKRQIEVPASTVAAMTAMAALFGRGSAPRRDED